MLAEIVIFIGTLVAALVVRFIFIRNAIHKSLAARGIPGPPPQSLIWGNLKELRAVPNWNLVIDRWLDEYGNVFGYYMGPEKFIVINDVELIKEIFITQAKDFRERPPPTINAYPYLHSIPFLQGDRWSVVRKSVSPTFSHTKVTTPHMTRQIESCVDTLMEYIKRDLEESDTVDVYNRMQALTMDVIARSALNMTDSKPHEPTDKLMNWVKEYFQLAQNAAVDLAHVLPLFQPVLKFVNDNMTAGRATDEIIAHLKREIEKYIADNESDDKRNLLYTMLVKMNSGEITADELIANAHIVLLAGYETTANGLTYALWSLAKNGNIQEKLRNEIKTQDISSPYLEAVWMEALRILPPVTGFVVRVASQNKTVGGVEFRAGDRILAPVWRVHHDPEVWPEPETFDPDRFSPENKKNIHPAAFLAFGLGPRYCLGTQMAHYEAKKVICRLLTHYRIEMDPVKSVDPIPLHVPTVIINPTGPVYLKFVSI